MNDNQYSKLSTLVALGIIPFAFIAASICITLQTTCCCCKEQ